MMLLVLMACLGCTSFLCLLLRNRWSQAIFFVGLASALGILTAIGLKLDAAKDLDKTYLLEWSMPWIEAFSINFHLGLTKMSFWLCVLTVLVGFLALFISKSSHRSHGYFAALSFSVVAAIGIFLSADVFLFFIFWECALIPLYFLIIVFGHEERIASGLRFIAYTQVSGLILLLSIIGLVFAHFKATGTLTFEYQKLAAFPLSIEHQHYLLCGFLLAFLIKLPIVPFHGWLKSTFMNAPASALLVGILIKTSVFGLLRFTWPLFPQASANFSHALMIMGVVSLLYGAVMAFSQTEPKHIIAYGMLSHGGLMLIGVFSPTHAAFFGVFILMIVQALSTAGVVMLLDRLYGNEYSLETGALGGLLKKGPRYSVLLLFLLLAGVGVPTFGNFIGEWLILLSALSQNMWIAILASLSVVLSAVYSLWLFQRLTFGDVSLKTTSIFSHDLKVREMLVYGCIVAILLAVGFFPGFLMKENNPSLTKATHVLKENMSAARRF